MAHPPKTKNTGLKGDDADKSHNSTTEVEDSDTETVDSEKTKEYDDTDHEHDYRTPGNETNEVKNNESGQDVETEQKGEGRNIDQNNTNNKGK